jgi:hypothetical protein
MNRRHCFCSLFIIVQEFKDLPTGISANVSHLILFRPKSNLEREAVIQESFPFSQKYARKLLDYVYEDETDEINHNFLYIDMSLKKSSKYLYYKNFDKLDVILPDE